MITTINLVNNLTVIIFFLKMETFKIYSLRNFQVYSRVLLATITRLYIKSPEVVHHIIVGSLYTLTNTSPFLPPSIICNTAYMLNVLLYIFTGSVPSGF